MLLPKKMLSYPLITKRYCGLICMRISSALIIWVDFTLIFTMLSYYWHVSSLQIGIATTLYGLPGLIIGPFIGRISDRLGAYPVLLVGFVARFTVALCLYLSPNLLWFMFFIFLKGVCNIGASPPEQIITRQMLNNEQLASNAGIMSVIDQLMKILAPLIGVLFAAFNMGSGFLLSAAMSIIGLYFALFLFKTKENIPKTDAKTASKDSSIITIIISLFVENLSFRIVIISAFFQSFALGLYDPLLALFLRDAGLPNSSFGIIITSTAVGAIIASISFKKIFFNLSLKFIGLYLLGFGITILIPGIIGMQIPEYSLYLFCFLWIINGFCYGLTAMHYGVIVQINTPIEFMGSITATLRSVQLALLIIAPLIGSFISNLYNIPIVFILVGCFTLLISLAIFAYSRNVISHSK